MVYITMTRSLKIFWSGRDGDMKVSFIQTQLQHYDRNFWNKIFKENQDIHELRLFLDSLLNVSMNNDRDLTDDEMIKLVYLVLKKGDLSVVSEKAKKTYVSLSSELGMVLDIVKTIPELSEENFKKIYKNSDLLTIIQKMYQLLIQYPWFAQCGINSLIENIPITQNFYDILFDFYWLNILKKEYFKVICIYANELKIVKKIIKNRENDESKNKHSTDIDVMRRNCRKKIMSMAFLANAYKIKDDFLFFAEKYNWFDEKCIEFIVKNNTKREDILSLLYLLNKHKKLTQRSINFIYRYSNDIKIIKESILENAVIDKNQEKDQAIFVTSDNVHDFLEAIFLAESLNVYPEFISACANYPGQIKLMIESINELIELYYATSENISAILKKPTHAKEITEVIIGLSSNAYLSNPEIQSRMIENISVYKEIFNILNLINKFKLLKTINWMSIFNYDRKVEAIKQIESELSRLYNLKAVTESTVNTVLLYPNLSSYFVDAILLLVKNDKILLDQSQPRLYFTSSIIELICKNILNIKQISQALTLLDHANIFSLQNIIDFCASHPKYADIYAQVIVALKKLTLDHYKQKEYQVDVRIYQADIHIVKIILAFYRAELLTLTILDNLFSSSTPLLTLSEPKNQIKKVKFILALEKIDHPLSHYILGKIYSGEFWGYDGNLFPVKAIVGPVSIDFIWCDVEKQINKAVYHFSFIPKHFPWRDEVLFTLYNMSLNSPLADHPFEIARRYKVIHQLQSFDDPMGKAVTRNYTSSSDVKKWHTSSQLMVFFNPKREKQVSSTTSQWFEDNWHRIPKLKKWFINNRHQSAKLQHIYDEKFAVMKKP